LTIQKKIQIPRLKEYIGFVMSHTNWDSRELPHGLWFQHRYRSIEVFDLLRKSLPFSLLVLCWGWMVLICIFLFAWKQSINFTRSIRMILQGLARRRIFLRVHPLTCYIIPTCMLKTRRIKGENMWGAWKRHISISIARQKRHIHCVVWKMWIIHDQPPNCTRI
jgi:hypothetical protein